MIGESTYSRRRWFWVRLWHAWQAHIWTVRVINGRVQPRHDFRLIALGGTIR